MSDEKPVSPESEEFNPGQYTSRELSKIEEHVENAWVDMASKLNQMSAHALDTREETIVKYLLEQHRVIVRLTQYIAYSLSHSVDAGRMADLSKALTELQNKGRLIGAAPELGFRFDEEPMEESTLPPVHPDEVNAYCLTILTQNVDCFPEWVTHIAMDATGVWFGYRNEPSKNITLGKWFVGNGEVESDDEMTILVVKDPSELPTIPLEDADEYWENTLVQVRYPND